MHRQDLDSTIPVGRSQLRLSHGSGRRLPQRGAVSMATPRDVIRAGRDAKGPRGRGSFGGSEGRERSGGMAGPHLQQPSFLLVGVRAALRRHSLLLQRGSLLLQRQERAGPGGQRSRSRCMAAVPVEAPAARAVQPRVSAGMLPRRSGAGGDFLTSWPR